MLFATCSYSLFGQSSFYHRMETAIDLGVCDSTYYYEGTLNTGDYSNDYVLPSILVFTTDYYSIFYR